MRKNQRSSYTRNRKNRYVVAKRDEHYRHRRRGVDISKRNTEKEINDFDAILIDIVWLSKGDIFEQRQPNDFITIDSENGLVIHEEKTSRFL